jgi:hypothetical protein
MISIVQFLLDLALCLSLVVLCVGCVLALGAMLRVAWVEMIERW